MLLAIVPIASSHAIVMRNMIKDAFARWEIDEKRIFRYVSDSHSSNICAFKHDYQGK